MHGCGWDSGAARERSSALAASVASRYELGADGVGAARPGARDSRVTASRYALGAEGGGAARPGAYLCPRVTAHVGRRVRVPAGEDLWWWWWQQLRITSGRLPLIGGSTDFLFDCGNAFQATRTDDGTVQSEKLLCEQAPGFAIKDTDGLTMVCEILVALQGRVDAARLFGDRLEQIIFALGGRRSTWVMCG